MYTHKPIFTRSHLPHQVRHCFGFGLSIKSQRRKGFISASLSHSTYIPFAFLYWYTILYTQNRTFILVQWERHKTDTIQLANHEQNNDKQHYKAASLFTSITDPQIIFCTFYQSTPTELTGGSWLFLGTLYPSFSLCNMLVSNSCTMGFINGYFHGPINCKDNKPKHWEVTESFPGLNSVSFIKHPIFQL